jgi:hypothetical protein
MRERKPREEIITTRSTNKTSGERTEKRERRNIQSRAPRDQHSLSVKQNQVQLIDGICID